MHRFFKKERLLLTLVVLFSVVAAIFGTILKHTAYRTQNINAPGIAFPFLAMHDGTLKNLDAVLQAARQPETPVSDETEVAPPEEPEPAVPEEPEQPAEPETPVFQKVDASYFSDALFIGDSRTDGLRLYAPFPGADYFCSTGLSVLGCLDASVDMGDYGTLTLSQLLDAASYGKIYVMLGINDVGSDFDYIEDAYKDIIALLREKQPDAIVYIMANLHVAKNRALNDPVFESSRINDLNSRFAALADDNHIYAIDPNVIFDDAEGYLIADYTGDNVHLYAKHYEDWDNWLCENAVVKPDMANPGTTGSTAAAPQQDSQSSGESGEAAPETQDSGQEPA